MKIYGYIEDGQLKATYLEEYTERVKEAGSDKHFDRIVSVEEQASGLDPIWKPVDMISDERLRDASGYDIIIPVPYDAGDHIAYRYERRFDARKVKDEIERLKASLAGSDYMVIKCYESAMLGEEPPYDLITLHRERQSQRDMINALEQKISDNS